MPPLIQIAWYFYKIRTNVGQGQYTESLGMNPFSGDQVDVGIRSFAKVVPGL